ncbi:MAG: DUF86 domain-containing protein [Deltaproteobacteria bacterium]|nr:DUF86 domain-containing protein [Deltaproteobacteria bacterium]MCB9489289.1 DUF86 domain-containing protein [Deltaproteobacteria bacterium]
MPRSSIATKNNPARGMNYSENLHDILDSGRTLLDYVNTTSRENFITGRSPMLNDAVIWRFCVIGEAARRTKSGILNASGRIPWARWVGLRNVLIHQYEAIDYAILWEICRTGVPELLHEVEFELKTLSKESSDDDKR